MARPGLRPEPLERLMDLTVFAPLGLAFSLADWLGALAQRGRDEAGGQLPAARLVGEMAVREGRRRAGKTLTPLRRHAEDALADWTRNIAGSGPFRPGGSTGGRGAHGGSSGTGARGTDPPESEEPGSGATRRPTKAGTTASELAIPGYDTLSASQVVQRLDGLTREELEAVRAYEHAGRGRKTVLNRVAQLLPAG